MNERSRRKLQESRREDSMEPSDEVGFSTLPDQVHRKFLKRGFEFTLLVTGDSGLGKSTFVNSLFLTDLYADRKLRPATMEISKTVDIKVQSVDLEEKGVRLRLTIVDTPGFGDLINADKCWKPIADYVDTQFEKYYLNESGYGAERRRIHDSRVHCCLYFIPPYVRGLRKIDIETMKSLQDRVNIVPVIAKADSLTRNELAVLKTNILEDIDKHNIKIYEFPESFSDDDEDFKKLDDDIRNSIPFAVIGSNTVMEYGNKRIRGRTYPWGIVDIESSENCDFTKLRTFLCSSHMQDLKDVTHEFHYENFRSNYMQTVKRSISSSLLHIIDNNDAIKNLKTLSTDEKDRLIHEKEQQLRSMHDLVQSMKRNMNTDHYNTSNNTSPNATILTGSSSLSSSTVRLNASFATNAAQYHHQQDSGRPSSHPTSTTRPSLEYLDTTSI